jgi:hypothetical protein
MHRLLTYSFVNCNWNFVYNSVFIRSINFQFQIISCYVLNVFQYTNTDISRCIWNVAWHVWCIYMNFKPKTCFYVWTWMVIGFWYVLNRELVWIAYVANLLEGNGSYNNDRCSKRDSFSIIKTLLFTQRERDVSTLRSFTLGLQGLSSVIHIFSIQ